MCKAQLLTAKNNELLLVYFEIKINGVNSL